MGMERDTEIGSADFESGHLAGLEEAAGFVQEHISWVEDKYGGSSTQVEVCKINLLCLDRKLKPRGKLRNRAVAGHW